ncbi:hypothetical protein D3C71_1906770 [compost metagenome]
MAWVITSSPTRLISWSTLLTATRMLVDSICAGLAALAAALGAAEASMAWGSPGAPLKKP